MPVSTSHSGMLKSEHASGSPLCEALAVLGEGSGSGMRRRRPGTSRSGIQSGRCWERRAPKETPPGGDGVAAAEAARSARCLPSRPIEQLCEGFGDRMAAEEETDMKHQAPAMRGLVPLKA